MKTKKIPLRKCVGCMESKPKKELIRVVKSNENEIFLDKTGKANGRGAYICKDINCLLKAEKNKGLERTLEIKIDDEIYNKLKEELENNE